MPLSPEDARIIYAHLRVRVRETLGRPDWDSDIVAAVGEEEKTPEQDLDPARLLVSYLSELEDRVYAHTHRAYENTLQEMGEFVRTEDRGPVRDIVLSITEADQVLFGSSGTISLGEVADSDELFQRLAKVRTDIQRDLGIELRHTVERDEDKGDDWPPEPPFPE